VEDVTDTLYKSANQTTTSHVLGANDTTM